MASQDEARLQGVGPEPLEFDATSVHVRAVRLDAQGLVLGRWQGSSAGPVVEDAPADSRGRQWQATTAGWQQTLPFEHGLELASGDWLQVWVSLRLREAGETRRGRLFVAVAG